MAENTSTQSQSTKISLKDLKKDLRDQLLKDIKDEIQAIKETIIEDIKKYVDETNKKNVRVIGTSLKNEWVSKIEKAVLSNVKSKKTKDKNKPTSPLTGYMLFCNERRPILKETTDPETNEKYKFGSIGKKLGAEWREMSSDKKQPYLDKALECKKEYEIKMKEYNNTLSCNITETDVDVDIDANANANVEAVAIEDKTVTKLKKSKKMA